MPYKGKWNVTTYKGHPIADGLSKQIMKRERRRDERRVGREVVVKEFKAWVRESGFDEPEKPYTPKRELPGYLYEDPFAAQLDFYDEQEPLLEPEPFDPYEEWQSACPICGGDCRLDRDRG